MDHTLSWYLWLEAYTDSSIKSNLIAVMKIDSEWLKKQERRIEHLNSMSTVSHRKINFYEPSLQFYLLPKSFLGIQVIPEPGQWALIELMENELKILTPVSGITFTSIDFYNHRLVRCKANILKTDFTIWTYTFDLISILDQYKLLQRGGFGTSDS